MERNRLVARIIDGIIVVGLTMYALSLVLMAQTGSDIPVQPLLVACVVVWIGPSIARLLILPWALGEPSNNRFIAWSNARDGARPRLWMLVARWVAMPAVLAGVLFVMNGRVMLLAIAVQSVVIVVLFGAFFRATVELMSLIATALIPSKATMIRRRAERAWTLAYFVGLPLFLLSRYHA